MLIIVDDYINVKVEIYDKVNSEMAIGNIVSRLSDVLQICLRDGENEFSERNSVDFCYENGIIFNEREIVNFYYEVSSVFNKRGEGHIWNSVYKCEREGFVIIQIPILVNEKAMIFIVELI